MDSVTAGIYPAAGPECRHGRRLYAHCPNYMHPYSTNVHTHAALLVYFFLCKWRMKKKNRVGGEGNLCYALVTYFYAFEIFAGRAAALV